MHIKWLFSFKDYTECLNYIECRPSVSLELFTEKISCRI